MANPGQSKAVLEEERKLIAVVEDDDQVTSIIVRLLEKEDYLVKTAKDGMDGLRLLEEIRPDLLIVDVMMPRLDGFQFVRALRYIKENKNIPIIFLTARSDARSMIEGKIGRAHV